MCVWASATGRIIKVETYKDRRTYAKVSFKEQTVGMGSCWGEWAVENEMKINPSKSKAVRFTRPWVKDPLDYSLANTVIPEASSCKYL